VGFSLAFCARADGDFGSGAPGLDERRFALSPRPWTWLDQVHGAGVVVVSTPGQWAGARADAAVTTAVGATLAVRTADCVPVLLWAAGPGPSSGPVIAAAHAGWRGLYDGVVEATVGAMRDLGAHGVRAMIGPCISAEQYEFSERDLTTMALRFGPDVVAATHAGAPALDVAACARVALAAVGVSSVDQVDACTAASVDAAGAPRFFSHRARRDSGRQASAIWIDR
jgi:YfiH family protein